MGSAIRRKLSTAGVVYISRMSADILLVPETGWINPTFDRVWQTNTYLQGSTQELKPRGYYPDRETCEKIAKRLGIEFTEEPLIDLFENPFFPTYTAKEGGDGFNPEDRIPLTKRVFVIKEGTILKEPHVYGQIKPAAAWKDIEERLVRKARAPFTLDAMTLSMPFLSYGPEQDFGGGVFYGTDDSATRLRSIAEQHCWQALLEAEAEAYGLILSAVSRQ